MGIKFWRRPLLVATVAALAFAACAPTASPSSAPSGTASSAPAVTTAAQRGAGGELRLLTWVPGTTLNVHVSSNSGDYEAARLITEPLAAWGPDGKAVPMLAAEVPSVENGDVTKDLKTITWKLKPNLKWSDGSAFSADDVVFTWEYRCNPETAATTRANCDAVDSVKAQDANTVVVTLKSPAGNFLSLFGVGIFEVVLQKAQFQDCVGAKARDCPANLKPIGTGPYKVTEFKPGDVAVYELNENFRDPAKPYFKTATFKGVADKESEGPPVCQTGEADYAFDFSVPLALLKPLLDAPDSKCQMTTGSYSIPEWVFFNFANPDPSLGDRRAEPDTQHPFLTDIHVRRALMMSANRVLIADQLYGPTGTSECNAIVFPNSKNTDSMDVCKYDLNAAEKELEDNGWKKGADGVREKDGVRLELTYQTATDARRQKTQEILKADWEKIGFKVNITNSSGTTFFTTAAPDGKWHFFADLEEWASVQPPDPTPILRYWICDEVVSKANNWSARNVQRYCDPEYDKLFDAFNRETDAAKRDQLAIAANDYLVQNAVVLMLVNRSSPTDAYSKRLKNINPSPFDASFWNIANWTE